MNRDNSFPNQHINDYRDLRLHQFIQIMAVDYGEKTAIRLAKDFCLHTTHEEDLRIGMKLLFIHGFYHELDILIKKNKKSIHPLNQKWAAIFDLAKIRVKQQLPQYKVLHQLNGVEAEDNDTICLLLINKLNIYFELFSYGEFSNTLDHLRQRMHQVKDPLLSSLYYHCLQLLLFVFYWKRNELILARKYGFRMLNKTINKTMKAKLHLNLSLSYIFDDYQSSMHHLIEARNIAEKYQENRLLHIIDHQNYPFICAHFNRPNGIITEDISEQAHLEIARGNLKEAQVLLSGITEVTPFTKYYLGRAHQDRKYFISSYNDFIEKRSDHFFARLPLLAMRKI
ncbi:AimR family lysis-lysogeny pheromone receptor [Paraliobacillus sp. JSM ZJ581]|uniref:AimR family lysis-lysogeny pheromone receptor n=1 Tax=Paraliobacillus sp. JSM ZJ581 TaxID=3342118 RepID=UPI0035A8759B